VGQHDHSLRMLGVWTEHLRATRTTAMSAEWRRAATVTVALLPRTADRYGRRKSGAAKHRGYSCPAFIQPLPKDLRWT
jgi:hypothetical protein